MIFDEPIALAVAIEQWRSRELWPTPMSSAEIAELDQAFLFRGIFASQVENAEFLQTVMETVDAYLHGSIGEAEGIELLRDRVRLSDPESLQFDSRLGLILRTNAEMVQGYGEFRYQQDNGQLYEYPIWELYRHETREKPRPWRAIWTGNAATARGGFVHGMVRSGRMLARANDPIWTAISRFNQPWWPFDFNSGMRTRAIDREEALDLGAIDEDSPTSAPLDLNLNSTLAAKPRIASEQLRQAVLSSGVGTWGADGRFVPSANWQALVSGRGRN